MAESVLIYYDLDPQELNPHIFNPSSGRPIYEENTDGAYLVREVVEDYVSRRIEAGKPAYLNAIVLAADEYENTDPDASNVKKVCAVCRIPGSPLQIQVLSLMISFPELNSSGMQTQVPFSR